MELKRVVVTGMGIISPVGNSLDEAWQNAANGVSGAQRIPEFEEAGLKVQIGSPVKNFDAEDFMGRREIRRTDRVTHFGLYACQQAMDDSGIEVSQEDPYEFGVLMGTGIGGIQSLIDGIVGVLDKGPNSVSPLLLPMMLPDSPAGKIAIELGLRGPNMSISTACAA